MTHSTTAPDPIDAIVSEFLRDYESSPDPEATLRVWCEKHPALADKFNARVAVMHMLNNARPDTADPIPARLGEFEIVSLIGKGGMGEIYRAKHERLGRTVAIKVIRQGRVSPQVRERFMREQSVLARLHQTHIVPIHTAGEEGPLQYFVMPFIDGASLYHVVAAARDHETSRPGEKTPPLGVLVGHKVVGTLRVPSGAERQADGPKTMDDTPNAHAAANGTRSVPSTLSQEYFRSVAQVLADAADALQHAHDAGILHRDLKPSNFMIDRQGHSWVIDFGLAAFVGQDSVPVSEGNPVVSPDAQERNPVPRAASLSAGAVPGTPQYMAPEQWARVSEPRPSGSGTAAADVGRLSRAVPHEHSPRPEGEGLGVRGKDGPGDPSYEMPPLDGRIDVWGLGLTLYELLTLRRAFDGTSQEDVRRQILTTEPPSPRRLTGNVPADLDAICRKAIAKDPAKRYQCPRELAEDLRRWLNHFPTLARPARTLRRMALWSKRNPGLAAALFTLIVAVGLLVGAVINENRALGALAQASKKELALQEIVRLRLSPRTDGWFGMVWEKVKGAAKQGNDLNLRNQAAACLMGLDAERRNQFKGPASSVAFHPDGKRLVMGGSGNQPARLHDGGPDFPTPTSVNGEGPVAWAGDVPVLFHVKDGKLVLTDLAQEKSIREFDVPKAPRPPVLCLSTDGALAAASVRLDKDKALTRVWRASTGEVVTQWNQEATALALSPDGRLIGLGDDDGQISVFSLPKGERIAQMKNDRVGVLALAFARDARRKSSPPKPGHGWLLAAGDDSGTVTVWDVEDGSLRSTARGSDYHINAVAFSPDGATLASAGRGEVHIWDTASGQLLLKVVGRNWVTGLSVAPDGRLAVSSKFSFNQPGFVDVWSFQNGRGIQSFRGLSAEIEKVVISPNDRFVAALAHDSRVGVWDVKTERLLHVFNAPRTKWVDNAALQFTPDSRNLFFSGSRKGEGVAILWDVEKGTEVPGAKWQLPAGLNNLVGFHGDAGTILFQAEYVDGGGQIGRVYLLKPGHPVGKPPFSTKEFDQIDFPQLSRDGSYLVMAGYSRRMADSHWIVTAMDAVTGKSLWQTEPEPLGPEDHVRLSLDRSGNVLDLRYWDEKNKRWTLEVAIEAATNKLIGTAHRHAPNSGWSAAFRLRIDQQPGRYYLRVAPKDKVETLLNLAIDQYPTGTVQTWNSDGTRYAWGRADGVVQVADLDEIQRRLSNVRLGW
ncbi:MAG: protein kinase [Gemmataceae bacterium]|nr:protein kinase [Gemmataceae bacterium]MCI0738441.1 protein kinase [Gemmataceae bacterium]